MASQQYMKEYIGDASQTSRSTAQAKYCILQIAVWCNRQSMTCYAVLRELGATACSKIKQWVKTAYLRCKHCRSDAGAITAEFAVILPAIMVLVLVLLTSARASMIALSCQDAARVTARTLAMEDDTSQAQSIAQRAIQTVVTVRVQQTDTTVTVHTQCPVLPRPLSTMPFHVEGYAVATRELLQ